MIHKGLKRVEMDAKEEKNATLASHGLTTLQMNKLLSNKIIGKGRREGGEKREAIFLVAGEKNKGVHYFCRKLKRHVNIHSSLSHCEFNIESSVKLTLCLYKKQ